MHYGFFYLFFTQFYRKDTDTVMQFPYAIRVWLDNYQSKLQSEILNEKKVLTPLFYTEFNLSYQLQLLLKNYFESLSKNIHIKESLVFLHI